MGNYLSIQLCQIHIILIYIYLFPSQFLKLFSQKLLIFFTKKWNEQKPVDTVCKLLKSINVSIQNKTWFLGILYNFVCRWFHAPSSTDCISYELNKIFYFQRSAAWPHFLPMICVYQYLCISKSFAVHKYIVCYFMFCSFYSLGWKDLWIGICTVFVEKCSVYHGRKSLKYTVLKSFQFMTAA